MTSMTRLQMDFMLPEVSTMKMTYSLSTGIPPDLGVALACRGAHPQGGALERFLHPFEPLVVAL